MPETARKNELLYRVYFILFLFVLFALVIAWKLFTISIVEGDKWVAKNEQRNMVWMDVPTLRGSIYADDQESLLATSVAFFDLKMDATVVRASVFHDEINALADSLALYPGGKSSYEWGRFIKKARQDGNAYIHIASDVDHFGLERLKTYPIFKYATNRGGLIKEKKFSRKKPFADLASRSLGVYRDEGMVGLENAFDKVLRGEQKKAYMQKLPGGIFVPVYDPTDYEIVKGQDLVTTINAPMQDIVHNVLLSSVEEHEAEAGVAILMEVKTGRIKAMSNLSRNKKGEIGEFHNMAIARRSEPGSTIKSASVLALLEDNMASPETIVDFSKGKKKFWDQWMYDSSPHGITKGTLQEAFEKSSNIGIASIMQDSYGSKEDRMSYYKRMMQFGFGDITGIELVGEQKSYIKHPENNKKEWYGTTVPWMAHGYELSMTPLQILNFYNAVANDGTLMKPQLVSAITSNEKIVKRFDPIVRKERIASKENIRLLQNMMEGVVKRGTGKSIRSELYTFAGKTGTTKVNYSNEDDISYNASFAGYWPIDNPKYSMIVVVYGLKGSKYYGNVVAGPVFKTIMDWTYAIDHEDFAIHNQVIDEDQSGRSYYTGEVYGFGGDYDEIFADVDVGFEGEGRWIKGGHREDGSVVSAKARISTKTVPDLAGMGLRDAIYVLENLGMDVKVEGSGKVVKQSINSGKNIDNQAIILYLN